MLDLTNSSFSGHETFAFRYSWLKKGVDAVSRDPAIFSDPYAIVKLGVGKNMVSSIRHWCLTAGLIATGEAANQYQVTELGQLLFGNEGVDPFLEDTGTLWLLHWLIVSNEQRATTWRWAFGYWNQAEFSREQMLDDLRALIHRQKVGRTTDSSLGRDIDTFLHCYVPTRAGKAAGVEDILSCPLTELKLLRESPVNHRYEFSRGRQPTLPDAVLGYALVEYWERTAKDRDTLTFEDIAYGEGSPARAFRLNEDALLDRLERIDQWTSRAFMFDQTAGLRQVLRRKKLPALRMLSSYFAETERNAA